MSISRDDVDHIATLAKLSLSESEKEALSGHLSEILDYVEQLNELNTDEVEPLSHVMEIVNVFREDLPRESLSREAVLANAPETDGEFFLVPRVIDS